MTRRRRLAVERSSGSVQAKSVCATSQHSDDRRIGNLERSKMRGEMKRLRLNHSLLPPSPFPGELRRSDSPEDDQVAADLRQGA